MLKSTFVRKESFDGLLGTPKQFAARQTTGIDGLDDVLCGGLPANRLYVIEVSSGSGKTTLALQFLREGVRLGRACYM